MDSLPQHAPTTSAFCADSPDDPMGRAGTCANSLIREKSPYLLQHAYNPVDWFPWGEEAFEKASREDKPIFLSWGIPLATGAMSWSTSPLKTMKWPEP